MAGVPLAAPAAAALGGAVVTADAAGDGGRGEAVAPLGGIAPGGAAVFGGAAGGVLGGAAAAGGLALVGTGETVAEEMLLDVPVAPVAPAADPVPLVPAAPGAPGDPAEPMVGWARMNDGVAGTGWPPPAPGVSRPDCTHPVTVTN